MPEERHDSILSRFSVFRFKERMRDVVNDELESHVPRLVEDALEKPSGTFMRVSRSHSLLLTDISKRTRDIQTDVKYIRSMITDIQKKSSFWDSVVPLLAGVGAVAAAGAAAIGTAVAGKSLAEKLAKGGGRGGTASKVKKPKSVKPITVGRKGGRGTTSKARTPKVNRLFSFIRPSSPEVGTLPRTTKPVKPVKPVIKGRLPKLKFPRIGTGGILGQFIAFEAFNKIRIDNGLSWQQMFSDLGMPFEDDQIPTQERWQELARLLWDTGNDIVKLEASKHSEPPRSSQQELGLFSQGGGQFDNKGQYNRTRVIPKFTQTTLPVMPPSPLDALAAIEAQRSMAAFSQGGGQFDNKGQYHKKVEKPSQQQQYPDPRSREGFILILKSKELDQVFAAFDYEVEGFSGTTVGYRGLWKTGPYVDTEGVVDFVDVENGSIRWVTRSRLDRVIQQFEKEKREALAGYIQRASYTPERGVGSPVFGGSRFRSSSMDYDFTSLSSMGGIGGGMGQRYDANGLPIYSGPQYSPAYGGGGGGGRSVGGGSGPTTPKFAYVPDRGPAFVGGHAMGGSVSSRLDFAPSTTNSTGPSRSGTYRPVYSLSSLDLSDAVINTIAGEAYTSNTSSVDAVIHLMLNRIGAEKGWTDLRAVARAPHQFEGYRRATKKEAEFIRERIQLIAAGQLPDPTRGATEFRAASYVFGAGKGKTFARKAAAQGNNNVGGNVYAKTFAPGPYASFQEPRIETSGDAYTRETLAKYGTTGPSTFMKPGSGGTASTGAYAVTNLTPGGRVEPITPLGAQRNAANFKILDDLGLLYAAHENPYINVDEKGVPFFDPTGKGRVGGHDPKSHHYSKGADDTGVGNTLAIDIGPNTFAARYGISSQQADKILRSYARFVRENNDVFKSPEVMYHNKHFHMAFGDADPEAVAALMNSIMSNPAAHGEAGRAYVEAMAAAGLMTKGSNGSYSFTDKPKRLVQSEQSSAEAIRRLETKGFEHKPKLDVFMKSYAGKSGYSLYNDDLGLRAVGPDGNIITPETNPRFFSTMFGEAIGTGAMPFGQPGTTNVDWIKEAYVRGNQALLAGYSQGGGTETPVDITKLKWGLHKFSGHELLSEASRAQASSLYSQFQGETSISGEDIAIIRETLDTLKAEIQAAREAAAKAGASASTGASPSVVPPAEKKSEELSEPQKRAAKQARSVPDDPQEYMFA